MKAAEFGDYSFSNFVVGECNSFAFKAAVSVTDNLGGRNTNPMLIWGEPGQGKTHLLKAMASSILEKHPDKKAIYVTGEEFTNDFIACIKNKIYTDFREGLHSLFDKCFKDNLHSIWAQQELYRKGKSKEEFVRILSNNMRPIYDSSLRQGYSLWQYEGCAL